MVTPTGRRRPRLMGFIGLIVLGAGCVEPPELPALMDGGSDMVVVDAASPASATPDVLPSPGCTPTAEVCDGDDNDCDGRTDETGAAGCPTPQINVDTGIVVCARGVCSIDCIGGQHDLDGRLETGCEYACRVVDPPDTDRPETCNRADDDCDGQIDEASDLDPPAARLAEGVCVDAWQVCTGDDWSEPDPDQLATQIETYERDERACDGLDNDCDGIVDEGPGCDNGCDAWDDVDDADNDPRRTDEGCAEVTCDVVGDGLPPCNGCTGVTVPAGWVCIPAGETRIGTPLRGDDLDVDGPPQIVEISRPFLMMTTEVTQADWRAVAEAEREGTTPSRYGRRPVDDGPDDDWSSHPVDSVSWYEAVWYADARSRAEGLTLCHDMARDVCPLVFCQTDIGSGCAMADDQSGPVNNCALAVPEACDGFLERRLGALELDCTGYRLPTEAEWEYAARLGGAPGAEFWPGDGEQAIGDIAWYAGNEGQQTRPVGTRLMSPAGLYDMHGNVFEWVYDWQGRYPDVEGKVTDPTGPADGNLRIQRGGAFNSPWGECRVHRRNQASSPRSRHHYTGFRLVRTVTPTP